MPRSSSSSSVDRIDVFLEGDFPAPPPARDAERGVDELLKDDDDDTEWVVDRIEMPSSQLAAFEEAEER